MPRPVRQHPYTEREFLRTIVEYAKLRGWLCYHVIDRKDYARRTSRGFPDLVLVRNGTLIFAEVKSEKGKISHEQRVWLDELENIPGLKVYVWRPHDWPQIEESLK